MEMTTTEIKDHVDNVHVDEEFDNLIPRMSDIDYKSFVQSIKDHGFDKPIIDVLPDGSILDGRHRFLASKKLGVMEKLKYRVHDLDKDEAVDFVVRNNKNRNNLTKSQLAMIGAEQIKLHNKYRELAKENQRKNSFHGNRFTDNKKVGFSPTGENPTKPEPIHTSKKVAKDLGVGSRTIDRAIKVSKEDPEAAKRVMEGKETANHAYNNLPSIKAKHTPTAEEEKAEKTRQKRLDAMFNEDRESKPLISETQSKKNWQQWKDTKAVHQLRNQGKQEAYNAAINFGGVFKDSASIIEDFHDGMEDAWVAFKTDDPETAKRISKAFKYFTGIINKH